MIRNYGFQLAVLLVMGALAAPAQTQNIPNTGQQLTPLAVTGARFDSLNPGLPDNPAWLAGQAVTAVVSPDHRTMLVLTSGYNLVNYSSGSNEGSVNAKDSSEYVFVFDISGGPPKQTQVIHVPNTYMGITFDPSGSAFYVSGGVDDNVHIYALGSNQMWSEQAGSPVVLGHTAVPPVNLGGAGLAVQPEAAGIAITQDGQKLVVTNYYNDSISILSKSQSGWMKSAELDLRPGKINPGGMGTPGGEYPLWVSVKGNSTAYVSSLRDREIVVVNITGLPVVTTRIKVVGQPGKMTLNRAQTTLYAAEDESDSVAVIDTATNTLTKEVGAIAPAGVLASGLAQLTGNNTNSVTLSPDEKSLYVTNGNMNDVAVLDLTVLGSANPVAALIPTGWYPNSVAFNRDGTYAYVVNGKSPTGANPGNCKGGIVPTLPAAGCTASNQYNLQLVKAGLQSFPTPTAAQFSALTRQVAQNNHFQRTESPADTSMMSFLGQHIQHVIYIIRENRTYDQILGDLNVGNGDPNLTEFGSMVTPNQHALASNFVTLDSFYDSSEVSMDGWPWSTGARAPDVVEKQVTVNYAGRGLSNDSEGTNRNVNVSLPTLAQRLQANPLTPNDPDVLPGTTDTTAPDGPENEVNTGHLWDQALRAGLSVRNYGFFIDLVRYQLPAPFDAQFGIPEDTDPHAKNEQVAFSTNVALRSVTDPYFRGFDNIFPDYYRYTEWARDVDAGGLPQLTLLRLMHDHTGNFDTAIQGVNTPELQVADNDYAVGLVAQKIASSQYAGNTLVFVIEDDSQDGADHVDSHRSVAFVVGPYVKHNTVVSTPYNTVSMVRTMEEILGLRPLNLNDGTALPMTDVFDTNQATWSYTATPSLMLYNTSLPLPTKSGELHVPRPTHDAKYWAAVTKGLDFTSEDRLDGKAYNRILWKGLMGERPYPENPAPLDLRANRQELLATNEAAQRKSVVATSQASGR